MISTNRLVLLALALTSFASPALGAATGSITISGTVAQATSIDVTSATGYNSLDLSTSATDLLVADVRERNNTNLGYKVTLTSQNAGSLKNGTLGSVPYTAKYNGVSVTLSATPQQVTSSAVATTPVNVSKTFKVSYTGVDPTTMMQGTYSDTLTFTIASP